MNTVLPHEQACSQVLQQLDLLIDNQLDSGSQQRLEQHLKGCPACSLELQARLRVRTRLREAAKSDAPDRLLAARIRTGIQDYEAHKTPWWKSRVLAPLAAAVVICFSSLIAYQLGHLRLTADSQESYAESVLHRVSHIMRSGLGDHIHCSVYRKFPKQPPSIAEMNEKLTPAYAALAPAIREAVPAEFKIVLAHQCSYHNRRFVHLALKSDTKLLSLVITRRIPGETFDSNGLLPVLQSEGIPIYRAGAARFQVAAFETRDHLAFVVSDLAGERNLEVMTAVAPPVSRHLRQMEL